MWIDGANKVAHDTAEENKSQKTDVEVNWTGGNEGDAQRGHWNRTTREFTPNDSTAVVDLWDVTDAELDADLNFINAVRVTARREASPTVSFLAGIFGHEDFQLSAEAIAYIGFTGTLGPGEVDYPIAICQESLQNCTGDPPECEYNCNIGRMINSGQSVTDGETGGWTDFNQNDPCTGGTDANTLKNLMDEEDPDTPLDPDDCDPDNPDEILLGMPVATTGGEVQVVFAKLADCWRHGYNDLVGGDGIRETPIDSDGNGIPDQPWNITLPVITCPGNNVGTCEEIRGAVNVNIIWINESEDPQYTNIPLKMEHPDPATAAWECTSHSDQDERIACWDSFAAYFGLKNVDGTPAPYQKKAIYFLPDCSEHDLAGRSGGENFGVMALIPALVK
jgi:hypothetical protein